jgi:hypothetical protein
MTTAALRTLKLGFKSKSVKFPLNIKSGWGYTQSASSIIKPLIGNMNFQVI